jgi:hypothetical protein
MSEIKHTSGPWQWDDDEVWQEGYDTEQHAPWLVGPSGERILTGQIHCLSEANARLIAAAPTLLEAPRDLIGRVPGPSHWHTNAAMKAVDRAIAAMAKATGNQPC